MERQLSSLIGVPKLLLVGEDVCMHVYVCVYMCVRYCLVYMCVMGCVVLFFNGRLNYLMLFGVLMKICK